MKILHIGNIANVPYLLCYGLKNFGVETLLVTRCSEMPFFYNEFYNPYQVNFLILKGLHHYSQLLNACTQSDILHFHCNTSLKQFFLRMVRKVKLVRHFHGSDIRELPLIRKVFLNTISKNLGEMVLVSTIDLKGYWKDAVYLPNPIDPIFFKTISSEEEYSIFLPTRLENKTKNVEFAFRAWEILRKMDRDLFLKVIFWGGDKDLYFQKYKNDKKVIWLNMLSRRKMAFEMGKSALIWGQFKLGVLGLSELEAMASGRPVLTKYDRYKNIYYDPQYSPPVVGVRTPKELAQRTFYLLSDKTIRKRFGQKSRKWVEMNHSVNNVTLKLMKIYSGLIE